MDIISLVGLILTVVALLLAIFQQRSAGSQAKELKEIRHSMSTQFIGLFPEFVPEVVALIQSANREVLISYGQVTYAIFSYRQKWLDYKTALEHKLQEGVRVDLLCLDEKERKKHQLEQFFLAAQSWETALNDANFRARLEIFAPLYASKRPKDLDIETFLNALEEQQKKSLMEDFKNAEKLAVSFPFAVHSWIVDGSRAIFTVPNFAEGPTEIGFSTTDLRLIQALTSIHIRNKKIQDDIQKRNAA